jgi:hypothetical protein
VSYTIIASNWGSPNDPQVIRQSTAALEQVFHPNEISAFLCLSADDKIRRLNQITNIVLGARLFQVFGSNLADPMTRLRNEVPKKREELDNRLPINIEGLNHLIFDHQETQKFSRATAEDVYLRLRLVDE